ncbi:MAG: precorrin-3B C(17)-methyltransferase [Spirochaetales bacterium]|nr:precorrin-3B C(17)-methyltransferase [Spirochaetales bacterium]
MNKVKGRLTVLGLGPGDKDQITPAVQKALKKAQVIAGYKTYLALIKSFLTNKEIIASNMREEQKRVDLCLEAARVGKQVVIVSSGDGGIYGMASLVLESLKPGDEKLFNTRILPGITAAISAASLAGAPLTNDFAVISLSDQLTPRKVILKRLEAAIQGDFVTVLYNPKSKTRTELINTAFELFQKSRIGETPVIIAQKAYRQGQKIIKSTLQECLCHIAEINMFSTVIIGNSCSLYHSGWFITKRGYSEKN